MPNVDVPWLAKAANPPVEDIEDLGKLDELKPLWPNAGAAGLPKLGAPNADAGVGCPKVAETTGCCCPNDVVSPEPPAPKADAGAPAGPEPPVPKAD